MLGPLSKFLDPSLPYELTEINNMSTRTDIHTFHIIGMCTWTNMSAKLHIYVPLSYYCSLHIYPILLHKEVQKSNKLQLWITMLLPYMNQQQIYPSNAKYMLHTWITQCEYMRKVCQHIFHIWNFYHQWFRQIHCTQMTVTRPTTTQDNTNDDTVTALLHS